MTINEKIAAEMNDEQLLNEFLVNGQAAFRVVLREEILRRMRGKRKEG